MTIGESLNYIKQELQGVHTHSECEVISRQLLEHIGINRVQQLTESRQALDAQQNTAFNTFIEKLKGGKPLQYILGEVTFQGMVFLVNESVLIPRPETEELVELVKAHIQNPKRILDVGTGSGVIACSLKKHFAESRVIGIDVDLKAVELAQMNASKNNLQVEFSVQDALVSGALDSQPDVVVSNPPYIPYAERNEIEALVVENEPELALFSKDALEFYKAIGMEAFLLPKVKLFFECHSLYAYQVKELLLALGYSHAETLMDSSGLPRFVHANK